MIRDESWSQSFVVGSHGFVATVQSELGMRAAHRDIRVERGVYHLRETGMSYKYTACAETDTPSSQKLIFLMNQRTTGDRPQISGRI